MPKYLVIFRTVTVWPIDGPETRNSYYPFEHFKLAQQFADDLEDMWPDWKDIQIYDYTGIQYVLVERRHRT